MIAHIIIQVYHVTIEKQKREVQKKPVDKRKTKKINCPSIENELEKKSNSRWCFRRRHINGTEQFYRRKKENGNANVKTNGKQLTDLRAYVVHMTFAVFFASQIDCILSMNGKC